MPPTRFASLISLVRLTALAGLATVTSGCSSNGAPVQAADASAGDDASLDAAVTPLVCGLPLPATCATTAPCTFATWGCPELACEGLFVVTDGTWNYYYSSAGGEFVGEVAVADASLIACPYGFQPPAGCIAANASTCGSDGGVTDAALTDSGAEDGAIGRDGAAAQDASTFDAAVDAGAPDASPLDAGNASDGG